MYPPKRPLLSFKHNLITLAFVLVETQLISSLHANKLPLLSKDILEFVEGTLLVFFQTIFLSFMKGTLN